MMAINNSNHVGAAPSTGSVHGGVRTTLRLEGLAVLAVSVSEFAGIHGSWWMFAALFFIPDISFLAYLVNPRVGAIAYNSLHSYVPPLVLGTMAYFGLMPVNIVIPILPVSLVWIAHIGFDRAVGYGLKYPSAFGDTHLGYKGQLRNHANPA